MSQPVNTIPLPLPMRMGSVNCYLLQAGAGFVLIDTGAPNARPTLRKELERLGCKPGALNLILLTHGDFDHTGNAAHLRSELGSKIAMHPDDARMAEVGDMFANRGKSNFLLKALVPRLIGFGKAEQFSPDVQLVDNASLSEYGLEARVIAIPGHSKGSIGVLTADGGFFCGDLFDNTKKPVLNSIIADRDTALRSAAQVSALRVRTVYPGHGQPFALDELSATYA